MSQSGLGSIYNSDKQKEPAVAAVPCSEISLNAAASEHT